MKFQDDISMPPPPHTHIRTSRNQYVPHFFKAGGIKIKDYCKPQSEGWSMDAAFGSLRSGPGEVMLVVYLYICL